MNSIEEGFSFLMGTDYEGCPDKFIKDVQAVGMSVAAKFRFQSVDAADLTQELQIRAIAKGHTLRHKERILAWLTTIATRLAINEYRRQRRVVFMNLDVVIEAENNGE